MLRFREHPLGDNVHHRGVRRDELVALHFGDLAIDGCDVLPALTDHHRSRHLFGMVERCRIDRFGPVGEVIQLRSLDGFLFRRDVLDQVIEAMVTQQRGRGRRVLQTEVPQFGGQPVEFGVHAFSSWATNEVCHSRRSVDYGRFTWQ